MAAARQWSFVADMTGNGTVTVSDLWLWIEWLYFLPGDGLIYLVMRYLPALARFLELVPARFGGPLSLFISFGLWIVVVILLFLLWNVGVTACKRSMWALAGLFHRSDNDPDYRRSSRK